MSLDPSVLPGSAPRSLTAPLIRPTGLEDPRPALRPVEVLSLQEGDRLIIHVDSAAGMSAGGAHQAGQKVRAALALDELPFDVPVLVVSPGIRVTVARPS